MIEQSVFLSFPSRIADKPILCSLIRNFDLEVNIIRAYIAPDEDGKMFAIMLGLEDDFQRALAFLQERGVQTVIPDHNLYRDDDLCVHYGGCAGQCHHDALLEDPETRHILYDSTKCIGCNLCIAACSYNALEPVGHFLTRGERIDS